MSIHGYCFDQGIGGKCGVRCCLDSEGECPSPEEIIFQTVESIVKLEEHPDELDYTIPELAEQYWILKRQIK